ncbi:MAG: aminotransferase class I/II-fold pyridoxal phosphate-dependent enzyme [Hyphomicrobiaceae bacterium]|nr:aminotransferase class I/II-fold pyridoxal phosphate-dependent enzyme [Hyphomicrobiaceae bacterium]MCC0022827.1 aminotransferase class I/II-fold pyridoxal phosphate-dependent enzyme [Hyphomicrobiaceae bacterium]
MSGQDGLDRIAASGRASARQRGERRANRETTAFEATRFDQLEKYRMIEKMSGASQLLDIPNPFYREHDGRAGATTAIGGHEYINFSSYDYLGLNADPRLAEAAHRAIDRYGISPSASRLVAGERPIHGEFERALARHYGTAAALSFVSGHATNVTTIGELMEAQDLIVHDSLVHNSVMVGAQLSGATRRSFAHNDPDALEQVLTKERGRFRNVLIVVEGLYSMDGDAAPLAAFVDLKQRYGCWLMVDDAHGLGTLGATGKGAFEHAGIDPAGVDIWMGTMSKTLASTGGYICGSAALIEVLKANASGFVFSVGLAPALAASALAALEILHAEPERVTRLHANTALFLDLAREAGLDTGYAEPYAIVPVILGDSVLAVLLSDALLARGVNVLPIIYPAVPQKAARLRFFISAAHNEEQIRKAVAATAETLAELRAAGGTMDALAAFL